MSIYRWSTKDVLNGYLLSKEVLTSVPRLGPWPTSLTLRYFTLPLWGGTHMYSLCFSKAGRAKVLDKVSETFWVPAHSTSFTWSSRTRSRRKCTLTSTCPDRMSWWSLPTLKLLHLNSRFVRASRGKSYIDGFYWKHSRARRMTLTDGTPVSCT